MSKCVYDFLNRSVFFEKLDSQYADIELGQLINELECYKEYVDSHIGQIKNEVVKSDEGYSITAPISLVEHYPSIEEVLNGSLFLEQYIINDPLYQQNYNDLDAINKGLEAYCAAPLSESDVKKNIYNACSLLKDLTPLVKQGVEYIKVYPLTKGVIECDLGRINYPDLSLNHIEQDVCEWMLSKLKLYDFEGRRITPFDKPSSMIYWQFDDDEMFFGATYFRSIPLLYDCKGTPVRRVDYKAQPSFYEFNNWINDERVKAVRDKYKHILHCHTLASDLKTTIGIPSKFDIEFLNSIFKRDGYKPFHELGLKLDLPCIKSSSIDKIAEIRERSSESIFQFRGRIRSDSLQLSKMTDFNDVNKFLAEVSEVYSEQAADLKRHVVKNKDKSGLIADVVNMIATYLTVPPVYREIIAGSSLYKMFKRSEPGSKSPYFFMSKLL